MVAAVIGRRQVLHMLGGGLVTALSSACSGRAASSGGFGEGADGGERFVCAPERPSAHPGEVVAIDVWRSPGASGGLTWTADSGTITERDGQLRWDLSNVPPRDSSYTAVIRAGAQAHTCSVNVAVVPRPQFTVRGAETGWSLLAPDTAPATGYGLYSYVVFGSRPLTEIDRQRSLAVIAALLHLVESIRQLRVYFEPKDLNITYVPVTEDRPPGTDVAAEWVLGHYDYARARRVLRDVNMNLRHGPYVIAGSHPSPARSNDEPLLLLDFSTVPPALVGPWMRAFLNQAAQERYWKRPTLRRLGLNTQLVLTVLGQGLPEIRKVVSESVKFFE